MPCGIDLDCRSGCTIGILRTATMKARTKGVIQMTPPPENNAHCFGPVHARESILIARPPVVEIAERFHKGAVDELQAMAAWICLS